MQKPVSGFQCKKKDKVKVMIANIVIVALIAAYCIYLIYKGYKNHKEGKPVGCAGCSGNCSSCSGCSGKTAPRRKTERRKAYGKFNRLYVLCIRSILDHLSWRSQHISVGFMDKEMA
ncbi:MAG: FeoB-associated Cys-rich membrane protein [Coprococcus sp.]